jgi:hypothetical protein
MDIAVKLRLDDERLFTTAIGRRTTIASRLHEKSRCHPENAAEPERHSIG